MKDFLSKYMPRNRHPVPSELKKMRALFENTCRKVVETLGTKPFLIRTGLNSAVLDSVMAAFASHVDQTLPDTDKRYASLIKNKDFLSLVTSGTTADETVRKRFELADKVLFR